MMHLYMYTIIYMHAMFGVCGGSVRVAFALREAQEAAGGGGGGDRGEGVMVCDLRGFQSTHVWN